MNAGLRDALPDLLNGKLSELDSATLSAHVEGCLDCRSELELLREVRASARIAPAIDASAIAARIAPYSGRDVTVRQIPAQKSPALGLLWKLAAAVTIATAAVFGLTRSSDTPAPQTVAVTAVPSTVAIAPAVVEAPDVAAPDAENTTPVEKQVASLSLVGNLNELSDSEIEELLTDLDGIETLPSAEPTSVTSTLDDSGLDQ
jgi:anti-sigma factor RsiW